VTISYDILRAAERLIRIALEEDCAKNDATAIAAFQPEDSCVLNIVAREPIVVAGAFLIPLIYKFLDENIAVNIFCDDGLKAGAGDTIAALSGNAAAILAGERTVLNFIQHLSGVATLTAKYVDAVAGTNVDILDTRKTTPGWRLLEKYAVKCGGGLNHRFNLEDMIMFKDNHIAFSGKSILQLINSAKNKFPNLKIACEADTLEQVDTLLNADVDIIMLDNMSIDVMKTAVKMADGKVTLEATGGISLENIREVAKTGVNRISIGAVTHSAKAVDIGMDAKT